MTGPQAARHQLQRVVELVGEQTLAAAGHAPERSLVASGTSNPEHESEQGPASDIPTAMAASAAAMIRRDEVLHAHLDPGQFQRGRLCPSVPRDGAASSITVASWLRSVDRSRRRWGAASSPAATMRGGRGSGNDQKPRTQALNTDEAAEAGVMDGTDQRLGGSPAHRRHAGERVMPRSANRSVKRGRTPVGTGLPRKRPLVSTPAA